MTFTRVLALVCASIALSRAKDTRKLSYSDREFLDDVEIASTPQYEHSELPFIPPANPESEELLWGSYRPGVYMGMRTMSPDTLTTGLMWTDGEMPNGFDSHMRHQAQERDEPFGWLEHDGRSFGIQYVSDPEMQVELTTSFVKLEGDGKLPGGEWVQRVSAKHIERGGAKQLEGPESLSLFFYVTVEDEQYDLEVMQGGKSPKAVPKKNKPLRKVKFRGSTMSIEDFEIDLVEAPKNTYPKYSEEEKKLGLKELGKIYYYGVRKEADEEWKIQDDVADVLREDLRSHLFPAYQKELLRRKKREMLENGKGDQEVRLEMTDYQKFRPRMVPVLPNTVEEGANVIVFQRVINLPFEFDIVYHAKDSKPLAHDDVTDLIESKRRDFHVRFGDTFKLGGGPGGKGFQVEDQQAAAAALSNMIGGMGYFHGVSIIERTPGQLSFSEPASLFTAVPSRSFFPRGFLWDEGFHQLLISEWDVEISIESIRHWLNLMDPQTGWIPREQILGSEARSRVPEQFQVQRPNIANPPTLLLAIEKLARKMRDMEERVAIDVEGSVDSNTKTVEMIRTFLHNAYPRVIALVDWFERTQSGELENSYRWRGRSVNHTFASGLDDYPRSVEPQRSEMHVDLLSWMILARRLLANLSQIVGNEENAEKYTALAEDGLVALDKYHWNAKLGLYCDVSHLDPVGRPVFVEHTGYVTLFPFALQLIPRDSPKVKKYLNFISDSDKLWSEFGLVSLSKSDELFGHGENYWKGPIWLNLNYLTLHALHNTYRHAKGDDGFEALGIYTRLRENLIKNVLDNYKQTGFFWEQYNPETGKGQRCHPFTGWTALIVNIMAERF